jgi:hypothetical protein
VPSFVETDPKNGPTNSSHTALSDLARWTMGRAPKDSTVDKLQRPTLSVMATIIHGIGTYIHISNEGCGTGSGYKMDVTLRSLDCAWRHCCRTGRAWPKDLALHADLI